MPLIRYLIIFIFFTIFYSLASAEEVKKIGKFKDWEAMILKKDSNLVCFAQTKPILQSPKKNPRDARLFVSFRPNEKIADEILTLPLHSNMKQEFIQRIIDGVTSFYK